MPRSPKRKNPRRRCQESDDATMIVPTFCSDSQSQGTRYRVHLPLTIEDGIFEMKATMDLGCHSPELQGFRRRHCEFVHAGFQTEGQRQRFNRKTSSELFVLFSHHGKEQDVLCLRSHMRPSRSILCLKVIFPMFSKPQAKFHTPHVPSTSRHIHSLHHDRAHDHHDDEHAERSTRSLAIRFPPDTTEAIVQNFFEDVLQ